MVGLRSYMKLGKTISYYNEQTFRLSIKNHVRISLR